MNRRRIVTLIIVVVVTVAAGIAIGMLVRRRRQRPAAAIEIVVPKSVRPAVEKRRRVKVVEKRDAAGEIVSMMEGLVTTFERTRDWTVPIRLASIYENGSYPVFESDQETARTLYMAVATMSANPVVASHARAKVVVALDPADDAGRRLPPEPAARMFRAMKRISDMERMYVVERIEDPVVLFSMEPTVVFTDEQNVHDHGVVASLRKMASELPEGIESLQTVIDAIAAIPDLDEAVKADALSFVAEHVDDAKVKSVGTSPKDALAAVWKTIEGIEDPEVRANATETLARQMADGYNRGHAVCATGRVGRILGALDGVVDANIRPTWAVREEMGRLAAKCSNEGLGGEAFERLATQTYVDDLGMSADVVRPIIAEYKAYIE